MQWTKFTCKGVVYDLTHLCPGHVIYDYPANSNRMAESFRVLVHYTNHCFTRAPKAQEIYSADEIFPDDYELRVFDVDRYELSKLLPAILTNLGNKKVVLNGDKRQKYFYVEIPARDGSQVEYEVYFKLKKEARGRLDLLVESAFVRVAAEKNKRPKGLVVRFSVVLHNTLHEKRLRQ